MSVANSAANRNAAAKNSVQNNGPIKSNQTGNPVQPAEPPKEIRAFGGGRVGFTSSGLRTVDNQVQFPNTQANRDILNKAGIKFTTQGQTGFTSPSDTNQAIPAFSPNESISSEPQVTVQRSGNVSGRNITVSVSDSLGVSDDIGGGIFKPEPPKKPDTDYGYLGNVKLSGIVKNFTKNPLEIGFDQTKGGEAKASQYSSSHGTSYGGVQTPQSQGKSFGTGWASGQPSKIGTTVFTNQRQIYRNDLYENTVKQNEADRATNLVTNTFNKDYEQGGTKEPAYNAVITINKAKTVFGDHNEFGWKDIASTQFSRGSAQEEAVKTNEGQKAVNIFKSTTNEAYPTGGRFPTSLSDVNANKTPTIFTNVKNYQRPVTLQDLEKPTSLNKTQNEYVSGFVVDLPKPSPKTTPVSQNLITPQPTESDINSANLGAGLISLSNQQIIHANQKSAKEFANTFTNLENQGAVFHFVDKNNNEIGTSSGPRSLHDFYKTQKQYGSDVGYYVTYPSRERALTSSVQKNTEFFATLSPNYWKSVGKTGFFSEKNAPEINRAFALQYSIDLRSGLGEAQGFLPATRFGGVIRTEKGLEIIGPENSDVSSFMRMPFSGGKTYNKVTGSVGLSPTPGRSSTELIPSTSLADPLYFIPTLGVGATILASKGLEKIIFEKASPALAQFGRSILNPTRERINQEVLSTRPSGNKLPPSRLREIEKTNVSQKPPTEEVYYNPSKGIDQNTFLRNSVKNYQDYKNKVEAQNIANAPKAFSFIAEQPKAPPKSVPSKSPVNVQAGPESAFNVGTFYTPRTSALPKELQDVISFVRQERNTAPYRSETSRIGSTTIAPVKVETKPTVFEGGVPKGENFQYFYTGRFPKNYLPQASATAYGVIREQKLPEETNSLGYRGKPPINILSNEPLPQSRASVVEQTSPNFYNEVFTSSGKKLGNVFGESGKPFGSLIQQPKITLEEPSLPESNNPLGRRGKPPVSPKSSDIIKSRASVVEETQPRFYNEVFSSKGTKLSGVFGETKNFGALRSTKSISSEIIPPEETNPLGYRGKPAVKSKMGEITQSRASVVEQTRVRGQNEVFTSSGRASPPTTTFSDLKIKDYINPKNEKTEKLTPEIYDMGKSFTRGSLKTKDVGLIRFEEYQTKNDIPEIGNKRFNDVVKKLPSYDLLESNLVTRNEEKSESNFRVFFENENKMFSETKISLGKGIGRIIPRNGGRVSIEKSFKKPPPSKSFSRNFEEPKGKTKEVGSGLIQLIKQEPKQINRLKPQKQISSSDLKIISLNNPRSKIDQVLSGYLKNLKKQREKTPLAERSSISYKQIPSQKANQNTFSRFKQRQKQSQTFLFARFPKQPQRNLPILVPTQRITPKQTPKQPQKTNPKIPTPLIPKPTQRITPKQIPQPRLIIPPQHPPKKPPPKPDLFGGSYPRGNKNKTKQGPTALFNLGVNNIFSSSLSIKVGKGERYEF